MLRVQLPLSLISLISLSSRRDEPDVWQQQAQGASAHAHGHGGSGAGAGRYFGGGSRFHRAWNTKRVGRAQTDGRVGSIEKKITKLDAELAKYKQQLQKMPEGASKVGVYSSPPPRIPPADFSR